MGAGQSGYGGVLGDTAVVPRPGEGRGEVRHLHYDITW